MSPSKPRERRPCALCQRVRVEKTKICEGCMELYKDQLDEDWVKFALEESDATARLIRNTRRHEVALDVVQYRDSNAAE